MLQQLILHLVMEIQQVKEVYVIAIVRIVDLIVIFQTVQNWEISIAVRRVIIYITTALLPKQPVKI